MFIYNQSIFRIIAVFQMENQKVPIPPEAMHHFLKIK